MRQVRIYLKVVCCQSFVVKLSGDAGLLSLGDVMVMHGDVCLRDFRE